MMALGLIDKLTNFLIPVDEEAVAPERAEVPVTKDAAQENERRPKLKVHSQPAGNLKVIVDLPTSFDDVQTYADYLRNSIAIVVNYQQVDIATQQRMSDFLNGVCYILGGSVQRISEQVVLYAYANIEVDKKIFAYSVPTYVRVKE
ncbi:cell division protein SepF [Sporomusa sp.]|uniref:cell division protein SepF n=1 Tax=Sporomusa sp. TaxID=2078658 RepID=UPI002BFE77EE|nr:cell division protein SepF [Sporomusa sp.]HWR43814.1 cell division protein SepF [Sporomusa sp.]